MRTDKPRARDCRSGEPGGTRDRGIGMAVPVGNSVLVVSQSLTRFAFSVLTSYDAASDNLNWGVTMGVARTIFFFFRVFITNRSTIVAENLALRHQLGVLQRSVRRPRLRQRDRILWVWLLRLWGDWRSCLMIVRPETVIRWHRDGFRLYWRWKSRKKPGRPKIDACLARPPC